jgi:hypothetical protein
MIYKDVEYSVVQAANPRGWRWTVRLTPKRVKTGISCSEEIATYDAFRAIDQFVSASKGRLAGELGRSAVSYVIKDGRLIPKTAD